MSMSTQAGIRISTAFDAGSIEVLEVAGQGDGEIRMDLAIRRDDTADAACDFRQWFHFRVQGARGRRLLLRFMNAGACTYAGGWEGYQACWSVDQQHWQRTPTQFDGSIMTVRFDCKADAVWFAYFEPYSWQRHQSLVSRAAAHADTDPRTTVRSLGSTVDGRDFDVIELGKPGGKPVWIIARQHPGEAMAEWFVEGLLDRFFDPADSLARSVLDVARVHIVPNMNPDGSVRGNLRANAAGANLNREWVTPSAERSPEVLATRTAMLATGCEFFLDVHGDEALPYVFVAGSEMLPGYTAAQARLQKLYCDRFALAAPDFQTKFGYEASKYSTDALKLASKWVGHEFGCLSLTLEMPFKDNANLPDAKVGWNGARSMALGAASLVPMAAVLGIGS
jgi:murein tripeptide amidase MpaA